MASMIVQKCAQTKLQTFCLECSYALTFDPVGYIASKPVGCIESCMYRSRLPVNKVFGSFNE